MRVLCVVASHRGNRLLCGSALPTAPQEPPAPPRLPVLALGGHGLRLLQGLRRRGGLEPLLARCFGGELLRAAVRRLLTQGGRGHVDVLSLGEARELAPDPLEEVGEVGLQLLLELVDVCERPGRGLGGILADGVGVGLRARADVDRPLLGVLQDVAHLPGYPVGGLAGGPARVVGRPEVAGTLGVVSLHRAPG